MADTSSRPSPYKPGHSINLVYPALDPNINTIFDFKSWYFARPKDVGNRYYPHPGLDADGNLLPASSVNDNAFFHILETNLSAPDRAPLKRNRDVTVEEFIEIVQEAANWVGSTELRIDTINTHQFRGERRLKIRRLIVQRITKFNSRKGQEAREEREYLSVPLNIVYFRNFVSGNQWFGDLVGLLERSTDRAVKHFDARMATIDPLFSQD